MRSTQTRTSRRAIWQTLILLVVGGMSLTAILVSQRKPAQSPSSITSPTSAEEGCGSPDKVLGEGEKLPGGCTLESFQGEVLTLGELQGQRPVVLNFWATWCPFCIKEMPDFQRVHEEVGDRVQFVGLDLLGVQGETREAARALARETGVRYPLAYDEGARLYRRLSPRTLMPTTVLARTDGTIVYRQFGSVDAEGLRALIREHLDI